MTDGSLLIYADDQFQLGDDLYGAGCAWDNEEDGWTLFGSSVTDRDVPLPLGRGSKATIDTDDSRMFIAPLTTALRPMSKGDALLAALAIEEAFKASNIERRLYLQLAGIGMRYLKGRTRGSVIDTKRVAWGEVRALVTFKANDPELWTP